MDEATCDILIVGGGPAGSTLAWTLAESGMDVAVMDKASFPRHKVCAGWITPAVVDELRLDIGDYAARHTWQPITGFNVGLVGGEREVPSRYGGVVSYGIRRCEFDHYLLMRGGARRYLGEPLKTLERRGGLWEANGRLKAPLVVGAGGHFCPVAHALGSRLGRGETVVAAQEIEYEMSPEQQAWCRVDPQVPELYFCRDLKGYGWCFRKGNFVNIGLGREDNQHLGDQVEAFYEFLIGRGRVPRAAERFKGHAYLLYSSARRTIVADGALLVGDAAGLAYAQSGEGIRPAVESALMAARIITAAGGDYSRAALAPYEAQVEARFGRRDERGLERLMPLWMRHALGRRLIASPWFSRRVVLEKWFLHMDQPPLAV